MPRRASGRKEAITCPDCAKADKPSNLRVILSYDDPPHVHIGCYTCKTHLVGFELATESVEDAMIREQGSDVPTS